MNKNIKIFKSNEIIESSYYLTLTELRVLLACIAQINPKEPQSINTEIELSVSDFAKIFDANEKSAYEQLFDISLKLHKRTLTIHSSEKEITTTWLAGVIKYKKNPSAIGVFLSPLLVPFLFELREKFTSYSLANVSGMSSIYGIRLYELLTQYKQFGKRKFDLDDLKRILGIYDAYDDIRNFKARVIAPAIKDVNKCSDLKITDVTYQKTGRVISHVLFFFESNKTKVTVEKKSTKVKVEEPDIKNTQSSLDDIYNENVQRFGKAKADEIKVASEKMNISAVKKQLEKIAETKI